jgi:hypothetical protein
VGRQREGALAGLFEGLTSLCEGNEINALQAHLLLDHVSESRHTGITETQQGTAQMTLTAKQVAEFVPIWDLLADGVDVGLLTNFPGEGIVFTVKHDGAKVTHYAAATLHEAIDLATRTHAELVAGTHFPPDEDFIEDEDNEIARMKWEEDRAEAAYQYHYGDEPDY